MITRPAMLVGLCVSAMLLANVSDAQVMQRRGASPPATVASVTPAGAMLAYDRLPGCAKRISIASLTRIYVIGCSDATDVKTFLWKFDAWQPLPADAHAIAAVESLPFKEDKSAGRVSGLLTVRGDGTASFADFVGNGFAGGGTYTKLQEAASGGGWIWAINEASGNHLGGTIRRSDGAPAANCDRGGLFVGDVGMCTDYEWHAFGDLYAKRITAGLSDAVAWAIGEDGRIYRQVNTGVGWIEQPGCATAIANAGNDNVWIVGCDAADGAGNRNLYRWNGSAWIKQLGAGVEVALQPDGKPWIVQADGGIWRLR